MNGARINETVTSTSRALQESFRSFTDTCNRQHPFEIPVSQLLRLERDRGFKHGRPTKDGSTVYHSQRASCNGRRPLETRLHSPGIGQTVTLPISPPIPSHHRSFSLFHSQAEKKRLQPPRRPPIPPRRPPISSYGRYDTEDPEDETLAKIAATTGKEYQNKSNNQQEQHRKRQNQVDKIDTPWFNFMRDVTGRLNLAEVEIKNLILDTRAVRSNTLRKREEIYDKFKGQVDDLKRQIQYSGRYMDTLPKEIRSKRKEAAKKGRKDYHFEKHAEATGLAHLRRGVDRATCQLDVLGRELAELMYAIDWTIWYHERLDFQREEITAATNKLKAVNSPHNQLRDILDKLSAEQLKIDEILNKLRHNLVATNHSLLRSRKKRYLNITINLATEVQYFGYSFHTECHLWRKLDRFALAESRFPEAIDHVIPEIEINPSLARLHESTYKINNLIAKMFSEKRMPPRMFDRWRPTYDLRESLVSSTWDFQRTHKAFTVGGLTLLTNPKLSSQFGRLKYAAFLPFEMFLQAVNDFTSSSQASLDRLIKRVEHHEKRTDNYERRKWVQDVDARLQLATNEATAFKRDFVPVYREFGFETVARLIKNKYNDPKLESILFQVNARAKSEYDETRTSEHKEAQTFNGLSQPTFYRDHMSANRLMDPVKLRGNDMLYPLEKNYPIEFISLEARVHQVLKAIPRSAIVGFDTLGGPPNESQNPFYISIATTEKVFLIDWNWSREELASSLIEFLENPDIVKVVHNTNIMTNYLSSRNIRPRGVVSIDQQAFGKNGKSSSRLTSTGHWSPPGSGSNSWKSFFGFITDLAFLSTYNLWTFLSAATPEHVSPLQLDLRTNILRAREQLHHKITTHNASLAFGPVEWDHAGIFPRLKKAYNVGSRNVNPLTTFTRLQAAKDLSTLGGQNFSDGLAAYYMFTTFNEELSAISAMLAMDNVALSILEAVERFNLTLHPEDLRRLKDAPKEEVSRTKVVTETSIVPDGEGKSRRARRRRALRKGAELNLEDKQNKSLRSHSGGKDEKSKLSSNTELKAKAGQSKQLRKPKKNEKKKSTVRSVLSMRAGKPRHPPPGPIERLLQSGPDKSKIQKVENVLKPVKHRAARRKVELSNKQHGNQVGTARSTTPRGLVSYHPAKSEKNPQTAKNAEITRSQDEGTKDLQSDSIKPAPPSKRISRLSDFTTRWFWPKKKQ